MKKHHIQFPLLSLALLSLLGIINTSCTKHSEADNHNHEATELHEHDSHSEEEHDSHPGHDHAGLIKLSDEKAAEYGVATEIEEAKDFSDVILVSGKVESKAADEAIISAPKSGILTLLPNVSVGMQVKPGAGIGNISASTVQGADPSISAAAARDAAKRELDRLKPLHDEGIVSTAKYNEALSAFQQAEAALRSTLQGSGKVASQKGGVITQLLAKSGEYVEAGRPIAMVSGNVSLTLRADVPEKYVGKIAGIESAKFRPAASETTFNLKEMNGRLVSSGGLSVSDGGYVPVYFTFDNNGEIAPGSFAEIYLVSGVRHGVVSVPKEALVEINGNKCVYSRHGEGLYEKHVVAVGAFDGERVEILSGLDSGEDVVVRGAQVVRMAETSATAIPGHTHNH